MRISTFHKDRGDEVTFIRGTVEEIKDQIWNRIYISSLFTYYLPKTVQTINYYSKSVENPDHDLIVGGIGATLLPKYIEKHSKCKIITGPLDYPDALGFNEQPIADLIPDYEMISSVDYNYTPDDAYFTRISIGCIRKCKFCAVPILEPNFGFLQNITEQVQEINSKFGEKKDLIVLDNNILALQNIVEVICEIEDLGFKRNAKFGRKLRFVDFNQGIDARLITPEIAEKLGNINIRPIRLAFDNMAIEKYYRNAIKLLVDQDFKYFTTYVMFNFHDTPKEFYKRLRINIDLSKKYDVKITSFPMRFVPINDIQRHFISDDWNWKFLRGIQCILNATHGMVSPLEKFFNLAYGESFEEFLEILTMPDNYIIYRSNYQNQANQWRDIYSGLDNEELNDIYQIFNLHHHQSYKVSSNNPKINKFLSFYNNRGVNKMT